MKEVSTTVTDIADQPSIESIPRELPSCLSLKPAQRFRLMHQLDWFNKQEDVQESKKAFGVASDAAQSQMLLQALQEYDQERGVQGVVTSPLELTGPFGSLIVEQHDPDIDRSITVRFSSVQTMNGACTALQEALCSMEEAGIQLKCGDKKFPMTQPVPRQKVDTPGYGKSTRSLPAHVVRELAVEAQVDTRTIKKVYRNEVVKGAAGRRATATLKRHGHLEG